MASIGSLSAWITFGDQNKRAKEYHVSRSEDGQTVTVWIASKAGNPFAVNWKDASSTRRNRLSGRIEVDGIKCGSRTSSIKDPCTTVVQRDSRPPGKPATPFVFAKRGANGKGSDPSDTPQATGDIVLTIFEVERTGHGCIRLADEQHSSSSTGRICSSRELGQVAHVIFKYRPLSIMKAMSTPWELVPAPLLVPAVEPAQKVDAQMQTDILKREASSPDISEDEDKEDLAEIIRLKEEILAIELRQKHLSLTVKLRTLEARRTGRGRVHARHPNKRPRIKLEHEEVIDLT